MNHVLDYFKSIEHKEKLFALLNCMDLLLAFMGEERLNRPICFDPVKNGEEILWEIVLPARSKAK